MVQSNTNRLFPAFDHFQNSFATVFGASPLREVFDALGSVGEAIQRVDWPRADLIETPDAVWLEVDLPGVALADVGVEVEREELRLTVERRVDEDAGKALHRERPRGKVTRAFALPCVVDASSASADLENGVLHVRLPKSKQSAARSIPVRGKVESPANETTQA